LIGGYDADFPIERLEVIAACFGRADLLTRVESAIRNMIWASLATDACALPLCALLRYDAYQLIEHAGTLDLMRGMHREAIAVAAGLGLSLDEEAHWKVCYQQIEGATDTHAGLFQEMRRDLERLQRSDVDRLNGAVVVAGRRLGIPTPYNESVLWLIRSLERRDDGVQ
jgi:2-dehydropantoate 2-reductase